MSLDVSRPITRREYPLDYISPLICDLISGQSGDVEINILPFDELNYPTGLLVIGISSFVLTWNAVQRALCYNVYRSLGIDGPYQLISSCQSTREYSDDPGPGSWYYRVSAITPEGETPLSPPVAPQEPPPGTITCPEEAGTDTPCDLAAADNTSQGQLTPDPFSAGHTESFGTFDFNRYKIVYTGGAYKEDDNPFPGDWKFNGYLWKWNNGTSDFDPDGFGTFGASQAVVEAAVPIGLELTFEHDGGTIDVETERVGSASNPVAGSPNPTFELVRVGVYPLFPTQIRIQDYDSSIWGDPCEDAQDSANFEWDGTFTDRTISGPVVFQWRTLGNTYAIQGKRLISAVCEYFFSHPTNGTGCGWRVVIRTFDGVSAINAWTGFKGVGNTPQGRYYQDTGCLTGPECLIIEEF